MKKPPLTAPVGDRRFVIVEANPTPSNKRLRSIGEPIFSEIFARILASIVPEATIDVVFPCTEAAHNICGRLNDAEVSGVIWTGSTLNAYDEGPEISNQRQLFEEVFDSKVPIFGACWGLQLMALTLGGRVRRNPLGREIGIAREIRLTSSGREHVMYADKSPIFDAMCVHTDEVVELPTGAQMLAENEFGIQAAAVESEGRSFWGVQYHPEFGLTEMASILVEHENDLLSEGFFANAVELQATAESYRLIASDPDAYGSRRQIYGVSDSVTLQDCRLLEILNWLRHCVRPQNP